MTVTRFELFFVLFARHGITRLGLRLETHINIFKPSTILKR